MLFSHTVSLDLSGGINKFKFKSFLREHIHSNKHHRFIQHLYAMYFVIYVSLINNITESAERRKLLSLKIPESNAGVTNILPITKL